MKRFLVGIGFSIVLISTGCAMSVFELKDYRVVNAYDEVYGEVETVKATATKDEVLRIEVDDYLDVQYEIDNDLDDKVEIDVHRYYNYRFSKNRLTVDDDRWYNIPFGEYLDVFLDGLQDEKLYIYDSYSGRNNTDVIVIRCSEQAKKYIRVSED